MYLTLKRKKMLPLTKEELKSHQDAKVCHFFEKRFIKKFSKGKNYRKSRDHCHYTSKYRGAAYSICDLRFNVSNKILIDSPNGSNNDYHFIIKELANEFNKKFECLQKKSMVMKVL